MQPHLFVLQPDLHAHPFSSRSTLCLTACILSLLSQSITIFPSSLIQPLPASSASTITFSAACLHMCSTQQLLFQWSFNAPTEGMMSSSNIILSQMFCRICSGHLKNKHPGLSQNIRLVSHHYRKYSRKYTHSQLLLVSTRS